MSINEMYEIKVITLEWYVNHVWICVLSITLQENNELTSIKNWSKRLKIDTYALELCRPCDGR